MVKKCVRVYIEGGSTGRQADQDFRRAWKIFLEELHRLSRQHGFAKLEPVRGKGRGNAYRAFKNHHEKYPGDLAVLLVDSEILVPERQLAWDTVARRSGDRWERPSWAREDNLYLMVPFVETWLLTDQDALASFFKSGFRKQALPTTNLEQRSKDEIIGALEAAIGRDYPHGLANEIIQYVKPERVKTLRHGRRLFEGMALLIEANAPT